MTPPLPLDTQPPSPWHAHADAVRDKEGDYADFIGWRTWIIAHDDVEWLADAEYGDMAFLYAICWRLWQRGLQAGYNDCWNMMQQVMADLPVTNDQPPSPLTTSDGT